MSNHYEIIKSKNYFRCGDCHRGVAKDRICFKMRKDFGKYPIYLCNNCVKVYFEKEIEALQSKMLDFKNMLGKVEMMIDKDSARRKEVSEKAL